MTLQIGRLLAAWVVLGLMHPAVAAETSPVGTWRTFDDNGHESGAVVIYERHGLLYGDVKAIADPAKADKPCRLCTDDRKDQQVLGMQVIRDVKPDGAQWDGGSILDPESGRVYRVKMHVEDGGAKLVLRGFFGISLFGRTQTWVRGTPAG